MKPKAPKRPQQPIEPSKTVKTLHTDYLKVGRFRLVDLLAKLPEGIRPEQAYINVEEDWDYCGCDKYTSVKLEWEIEKLNDQYDKEIERYKRKFRNYEKEFAEYEVKQKAYLEWKKNYDEEQAILAKTKAEQDKVAEIARLEKCLAKLKKQ